MKFYKWCILAMACLLMAGFSTQGWAKPVSGLMIYWRGETDCAKGFKQGLQEMGYELKATEFNATQDKGKLDQYLSSLDTSQYDFVYTFGTTVSTRTARKVTATPIFFGIVTNPVKAGLVQSWDSSGNNVTGVSHAIPYEDQIGFISTLGAYQKIGMVYNPSEKNSQIALQELSKLLNGSGVEFVAEPVDSEAAIETAVSRLIQKKPDLVYLPSDSFIQSHGKTIIAKLNQGSIPTYAALPKYIKAGAMIGIVSSYHKVGIELASSADRVLKGAAPADVPSKTLPLDSQKIRVNAKTAEQIGAEIPYEILSNAEIVE